MTAWLLDEAWAKVDPAAARSAGYTGIIGYVSQSTTGKNLTVDDVARIHATGLDVGLVYEYNTQSALGGYVQGQRDAYIAVAHAQGLGAPKGVCLYASVDWDVQRDQVATVLNYAHGFADVARNAGYRYGIYAGYRPCAYLVQAGYDGLLWQTYAWSSGQWVAQAAIRQVANGIFVAGVDVDRDVAQVIDWGQWSPQGGSSTMTQPASNEDVNVYAGMFLGGPSCGKTVPTEFRVPSDTFGNALFSQLAYVRAKLDALSVPASVVTDEQMAAIGQLNNLLGQVAAHIR